MDWRVYGYHIPVQNQNEKNCQDIELIAPVAPGYQGEMINWLAGYQAHGVTPIASALQQAVSDFVLDAKRVNSVVLISDGKETCGEDPCAVVKQLEDKGAALQNPCHRVKHE